MNILFFFSFLYGSYNSHVSPSRNNASPERVIFVNSFSHEFYKHNHVSFAISEKGGIFFDYQSIKKEFLHTILTKFPSVLQGCINEFNAANSSDDLKKSVLFKYYFKNGIFDEKNLPECLKIKDKSLVEKSNCLIDQTQEILAKLNETVLGSGNQEEIDEIQSKWVLVKGGLVPKISELVTNFPVIVEENLANLCKKIGVQEFGNFIRALSQSPKTQNDGSLVIEFDGEKKSQKKSQIIFFKGSPFYNFFENQQMVSDLIGLLNGKISFSGENNGQLLIDNKAGHHFGNSPVVKVLCDVQKSTENFKKSTENFKKSTEIMQKILSGEISFSGENNGQLLINGDSNLDEATKQVWQQSPFVKIFYDVQKSTESFKKFTEIMQKILSGEISFSVGTNGQLLINGDSNLDEATKQVWQQSPFVKIFYDVQKSTESFKKFTEIMQKILSGEISFSVGADGQLLIDGKDHNLINSPIFQIFFKGQQIFTNIELISQLLSGKFSVSVGADGQLLIDGKADHHFGKSLVVKVLCDFQKSTESFKKITEIMQKILSGEISFSGENNRQLLINGDSNLDEATKQFLHQSPVVKVLCDVQKSTENFKKSTEIMQKILSGEISFSVGTNGQLLINGDSNLDEATKQFLHQSPVVKVLCDTQQTIQDVNKITQKAAQSIALIENFKNYVSKILTGYKYQKDQFIEINLPFMIVTFLSSPVFYLMLNYIALCINILSFEMFSSFNLAFIHKIVIFSLVFSPMLDYFVQICIPSERIKDNLKSFLGNLYAKKVSIQENIKSISCLMTLDNLKKLNHQYYYIYILIFVAYISFKDNVNFNQVKYTA